jgi:hypothetical protein
VFLFLFVNCDFFHGSICRIVNFLVLVTVKKLSNSHDCVCFLSFLGLTFCILLIFLGMDSNLLSSFFDVIVIFLPYVTPKYLKCGTFSVIWPTVTVFIQYIFR